MKPPDPLHQRARKLRRRCTDAERLLWRNLRHNLIEGVKFRQQEPLENYIVDFLSYHPRLVVELDGGQHQEQQVYDEKRDECLRRNGFVVLRFWNNDVFQNLDGVLEVIREHCLRLGGATKETSDK